MTDCRINVIQGGTAFLPVDVDVCSSSVPACNTEQAISCVRCACRRHPFPSSAGPRPVLARGQRDPTRADVSKQGEPAAGQPLPSAKPAPGPSVAARELLGPLVGANHAAAALRSPAEPKGAKPLRCAVVPGRGIYWAPPDASGPGRSA